MDVQRQINKKQMLFYSAYFLYFTATVLQTTMFTQYGILAKLFALMRYVSFALAAVKVFFDLQEQWRTENSFSKYDFWKRFSFKALAVYLILMLLTGVGSIYSGDRSLFFVLVFLIAAKGIGREQVMRYTLFAQVILMIFVMLSSSAGVIPDLLFKRDYTPIRHALGYTYPSVMVTYLFFILLLYFWIKNTPINRKEFFAFAVLDFLIYKLTDSKTGFLMILLLLIILFLVPKYKILCNMNKKSQAGNRSGVVNVIWNIYDYIPVLLTVILILFCILMPTGIGRLVNNMLTDRIRLTANAIMQYGIHPFGNKIEWIGFGGSLDTDSLLESYNFVDSSYGYILINYGWILSVLALAGMVWCCRQVRKNESHIRMCLFMMVLIYCFIEPRLLELQVNTFLFVLSPLITEILPGMKLGNNIMNTIRKKKRN